MELIQAIRMKDNMKELDNLISNKSKSIINENFKVINLDKIKVDHSQPRKKFDENSLQELASSISLYGVMMPIVVSEIDHDRYVVRQGERRYRASLLAGMHDIPAIVDSDKNNVLEKQLIENIARENLSMVEIANAIKYLVEYKKIKKIDIAKSLAKSNAFVSNYYAFATFDHPLKDIILDKTQDLIIIIELKRLLENSNDVIFKRVEDFISKSESINRHSLNNLKLSLDYYIDSDSGRETIDYNNDVLQIKHGGDNNYDFVTPVEETQSMQNKNSYSVNVDLVKVLGFLNKILPDKIREATIKKVEKKFGAK